MPWPFAAISRMFGKVGRAVPARRSFEGAAGGRRWDGAGEMSGPNIRGLAARGPLMRRARYQAANHPLAAQGVEVLTAALVGVGFTPQAQHPDAAIRRELGLAWHDFAQDVGQGASLLAVLEQAVRGVVRDGEAFVRMELRERRGRLSMRLQLLDPEQIDPSLTRDLGDGRRIVAGVEIDAAGDVAAFHVREPLDVPFATIAPPVRVPAEEILHLFEARYPGQVRGVSALAPVLLRLHDYDATADALLVKLKTESLLAGFIRDQDGGAAGLTGARAGDVLQTSLEPGTLVNLPPGTDISFSSPNAGGADATGFLRSQQREIAAGLGLLYAQLTGDLSDTNYSSARFGLIQFRRRIRLTQRTVLVDRFLGPLWRTFLDMQAANGRIPAADYDRGPEAFHAVKWTFPAFEAQDPEKEVRADALAVANGFRSRPDVVESHGRDIDELDAEIAADTFTPRSVEAARQEAEGADA